MDTSEEYVEMCSKAEEIQKDIEEAGGAWIGNNILYHVAPTNQPHNRDGYYHIVDENAIRRCETCGNEESYIKSSIYTWLPRQDQSQEMVIGKVDHWTTGVTGLWNLYCFAQENDWQSMEQLWLKFVMKEKYRKTWKGGEWIYQ